MQQDTRTGVMWPQAKDTWSPLEAARGRKDPPLQRLGEGSRPSQHPSFRLLASRTAGE